MKSIIKFSGILFCTLLFLNVRVEAQVNEAWASHWNNTGNDLIDEPYDIAVDASGNVYVTGSSEAWSAFASSYVPDYITIKYNSSGAEQWAKTYNGPYDFYDEAYGVAVDGSGNVYVTGRSYGASGYYDYCTIKYDAGGNQQWVARYDGPNGTTDEAYDIALDALGNVYVTGKSTGGIGLEFTTIKYNPATGDTVWVRRTVRGGGKVLKVDAMGDIDAGGYAIISGSIDCFTVKYNSAGDTLWTRNYDYVTYNDEVYDLATDGGGNVYVTGYSDPNTGKYDYITIMYSSSGTQQWATRYNGAANDDDWAYGIAVDAFGTSICVTGYSTNNSGNRDYETIKYNASGNQQWEQRYNGAGNDKDEANDIAMDAAGNVYVTGGAVPSGTILWDYVTIKYDAGGNQQWLAEWNDEDTTFTDDQEIATAIALDATGNVYVTGWTDGTTISNYIDIATLKYTQGPGGIEDANASGKIYFSVYPNPANDFVWFKSSGITLLSKEKEFSLKIYNVLGQEVKAFRIPHSTFRIDVSDLPAGLYAYRIGIKEKNSSSMVDAGRGKLILTK